MDYEKKYKEALGRAKKYMFDGRVMAVESLIEYIFPELRKTNDETTQENLHNMILYRITDDDLQEFGLTRKSAISWITKHAKKQEKQ